MHDAEIFRDLMINSLSVSWDGSSRDGPVYQRGRGLTHNTSHLHLAGSQLGLAAGPACMFPSVFYTVPDNFYTFPLISPSIRTEKRKGNGKRNQALDWRPLPVHRPDAPKHARETPNDVAFCPPTLHNAWGASCSFSCCFLFFLAISHLSLPAWLGRKWMSRKSTSSAF